MRKERKSARWSLARDLEYGAFMLCALPRAEGASARESAIWPSEYAPRFERTVCHVSKFYFWSINLPGEPKILAG